VLPKDLRGYGTAIVAAVGIFGVVAASLVGKLMPWRVAYLVGGGLGILLLLMRVSIRESAMFQNLSHEGVSRGNFLALFSNGERFLRYLRCILIGLPTWCVVGILVTFSPEFAPYLGVTGKIAAGMALLWCYAGITLGSFASGFLSQAWGSRRKVVGLFIGATAVGAIAYLLLRGLSPMAFYALCGFMGFATGYWAVFVTIAAEQFGTNLRSTVATTVPNFVRGTVPLITLGFRFFQGRVGFLGSAWIITGLGISIALLALMGMRETHGRDLDFVE
jgi:hypothetical protein